MCGFIIKTERPENTLTHRGVEVHRKHFWGWDIVFNSLPLSSHKTGITQPIISRYHGRGLGVSEKLMVFNGEIFNYRDLMPRAASDVHYLKKLMEEKTSEEIFQESLKWDGFWAISIIDKEGEVIYSFTDFLGKKQLYGRRNEIASEIQPLLRNNDTYQAYNESSFGTSRTNFREIKRLRPGVLYVTIKDQKAYPYTFTSLNILDKPTDEFDLVRLIRKSVQQRMENRYDGISILLSSGLDSNIILHHLMEFTRDIEIVSTDNGERPGIERIAEYYGVDVKFVSDEYTPEDFNNAVRSYEHSLDYGSLMPNYKLFQACSNSVVFTGDGADELFGGYKRNLESDTWEYDVLMELPYYHNIRLDRTSMAWTKEARNPLMSFPVLKFASKLSWEQRKNKAYLREAYRGILPDFIIDSPKIPLRDKGDKERSRKLIRKTHAKLFHK